VIETAAERQETDMLGVRALPKEALYGIHTLRAIENFDVSGIHLGDFPGFIESLVMVKNAAVLANEELSLLPGDIASGIKCACALLLSGDYSAQFPIDMMQGGAGTSTNMNVNEVIANLALLEMGCEAGDYSVVSPNDHVNLSQSTNDVYPTAVRLTVLRQSGALVHALAKLTASLRSKAVEFADVLKVGRTQLQDAVPMTLGQEFEAFAETVDEDRVQLLITLELMREVNLGGTAIGTGVNAPVGFASVACRHLNAISGVEVRPARNLIEATSDTGAFVSISSMLKRIAVKLSKVCNDLRLLSSGPRAGFGEIRLPARQAGSSIMPGKVNPVIPEMMNQINFQVIGNDLTITLAAGAGQLQLNAMEPVMVLNLLQSIRLLTRGIEILRSNCIEGIEADVSRCRELYDHSLVRAASLNPVVGYNNAALLAKRALATGVSLRDVVVADSSLSEQQRVSILSLLG
jgi:aspartate ammonia-lyase